MKRLLAVLVVPVAISLAAETELDRQFPVRGFCIGAPSASQVDRFVQFINEELAPRAVNTLILRVDYNFQYTSHPELRDNGALVDEICDAFETDAFHAGLDEVFYPRALAPRLPYR